jgi:diguanylate cyclase (GGDEF)-like protein/PAS domain S-box-containing protein
MRPPERPSPAERRSGTGSHLLGSLRLDRRLLWIVALYLVLIGGIVGYNARAMARERGAAVIVNVAARQRALAERYVRDVVLRTQGVQADPEDDAAQLTANAEALLNGGQVTAVQGADLDIHIPPASDDPRVIAKLDEERRLIGLMVGSGDLLMSTAPADPRFADRLRALRILGGQVTSISNDAVGQMTRDTEAAFSRLVVVGIALGVLGAIVAIGMGLLLRRAGARRSAQFRSLVHNASDLITVIDREHRIRYQSPSLERLLNEAPGAFVDRDYLELVDAEDRPHVVAILGDVASSPGEVTTAEYRVRIADGSFRYVESIVSNLLDEPTVMGVVLNTRDVTDRRMLEEELAHQAFHDSLTGLSNRAVLRDRMDHAIARSMRHGQRLAVLLLDLDGFKTINDSLGHDAGDELLVAVAGRLEASARSSDTVARLGGDEFAILLEDDVGESRARAAAERLLAELSAPFQVREREVFIRGSVGIAIGGGQHGQTDELLRNADTAMYAAKGAGRGRFAVFQPEMHERALSRFEVQGDLQHATDRGELRVHYQPIVDFATGGVDGMEALVRWEHPTRGLLSPVEFIQVAEDTGLIVRLGRWVLIEACRQTVVWRAGHRRARSLWVSVNLSTRQLFEPDLVGTVREVLDETGLDPSALVLEITEGSLMQNMSETAVKLRGLKELGVRLAIDDFGTGSSSLGYLREFPIDVLKIDKTFVDQVTAEGSKGPALVRAIIELADTLQLETVAEGIELPEQLAELRTAGCRSGQGYLFARPLDPVAMSSLLQRGRQIPTAVA